MFCDYCGLFFGSCLGIPFFKAKYTQFVEVLVVNLENMGKQDMSLRRCLVNQLNDLIIKSFSMLSMFNKIT